MNDKYDIEKILARYRGSPGPDVKRTVLERFNNRFSAAVPPRNGFWRRPVPLYLAVAAVLAALIVAAPIQNRLLHHPDRPDSRQEAVRPADTDETFQASDLTWNIAPNDLI